MVVFGLRVLVKDKFERSPNIKGLRRVYFSMSRFDRRTHKKEPGAVRDKTEACSMHRSANTSLQGHAHFQELP